MFDLIYNKNSGTIIKISQHKKDVAVHSKLKPNYAIHTTGRFDTPIAYKIMTGKLSWKNYIIKNSMIVNVQIRVQDPSAFNKLLRRKPLQKIEKCAAYSPIDVEMIIRYHKKDNFISIMYGDRVEYEPNRILYLFFTAENDPTILYEWTQFYLVPDPLTYAAKYDISKCGIYTLRHFSNINYEEIE